MGSSETLLKFPCLFPIKAMGRSNAGLEALLFQIVSRHDPHFDVSRMSVTSSRAGNYVSVTLQIHAESKEQLDTIYRSITACEAVLYTL